MPRSKIALIYVGGSIGMRVNQRTGRMEPIESLNEIHRFLPELQGEVSLSFYSQTTLGSSDITPEHWVETAQLIKSLYDTYEGFVVVHGTNTMAYTAAALSFALQGLSKPIVLTGAIMPINDLAGDGRLNLVNAIRAAQLDIAEVCVALGHQVLRGNRSKKVDQSLIQSFDSPQCPPLAVFDERVVLHPDRLVRRKRSLQSRPTFESDVALLTLHPGMHVRHLEVITSSKPKGIVLRAYGPGMLPDSLMPWLRSVTDADIPVVITSQTVRGAVDLHRYRKQIALEKLGIISGKDMTAECATVKLMWALTQAKTPGRLRDLIEKNLVGELTEPGA